MPELPEVETVRQGLAKWVTGRRIDTVEVQHPRAIRRHLPGDVHFAAVLAGRTVLDVARRGKYLWLPLDSGDAIIGHLGMSGQLLMQPADAPDEVHLRVRFTFGDGGPQLRFVDQRTFGGLSVSQGGATLPDEIAHIARDPIDPAFYDADFVAALRRKRTEVKRALLDQTLISGIGNIYADEALWRARLHGTRPTDALTAPAASRLLGHVRDVLGAGHRRRRHQLRRALRQRERRERLLRPVPGRVRPRGPALPPLRYADPPRAVHEPLLLQLPALPAPPPGATVLIRGAASVASPKPGPAAGQQVPCGGQQRRRHAVHEVPVAGHARRPRASSGRPTTAPRTCRSVRRGRGRAGGSALPG